MLGPMSGLCLFGVRVPKKKNYMMYGCLCRACPDDPSGLGRKKKREEEGLGVRRHLLGPKPDVLLFVCV